MADETRGNGPLDRFKMVRTMYREHPTVSRVVTLAPFFLVAALGVWVSYEIHRGTLRNTQVVMWGKNVIDTGFWIVASRLAWEWGLPGISLTKPDGSPNPWAYVLSAAVLLGAALIWQT